MTPLFLTVLLLSQSAAAGALYDNFKPNEAAYVKISGTLLENCLNQSDGVTIDMRNCHAAQYKRLDARLNREYQAALRRLGTAGQRRELREAQRRWLKARWNACYEEAKEEMGGTLWLIIVDSCANEEMVRRTAWLNQYGRR